MIVDPIKNVYADMTFCAGLFSFLGLPVHESTLELINQFDLASSNGKRLTYFLLLIEGVSILPLEFLLLWAVYPQGSRSYYLYVVLLSTPNWQYKRAQESHNGRFNVKVRYVNHR